MHVALITTSYPDATPGSEAAGGFVADFAAQLGERMQVTVVAAASNDGVTREGDVNVVRFGVPRLPLSLLRPFDPRDWPDILRTLRNGGRVLDSIVQEQQPDHVFAFWVLPSGYWARRAAATVGIPFSVWALGSDVWGLGRLPLLKSVLKRVLRDAHSIFADGIQLAQEVSSLAGRDCQFLASSRRLQAFVARQKASSAPYRLAFLGRWHRNKGIDVLLGALEQLDDQDWGNIAKVRVCGGGPLHDEVHRRSAALAARGRPLEVGGYLSPEDAAELLAWADYLLLPSRIESIPVVFSDATQTGTPIVATPVGDLPRLFAEYRVGILASTANADGFANAMREALARSAQEFSAGLDNAAKDFDIATAVDNFIASLSDFNDD